MKTIIILLTLLPLSIFAQIEIDSGLVALYPFCGDGEDLSVNQNHANINGGIFVVNWQGQQNSAIELNGVQEYVSAPNSSPLENLSEELSISLWFNTQSYYFNQVDSWAVLITKSDDFNINSRQFSIFYNPLGEIYFNENVVANQVLELDTWYHIVMTYSNSTVNCYLNGELIGNQSIPTGIASNNLSLDIGRDNPGVSEFYDGVIDDIYIHDRVLSNAEINFLAENSYDCNPTSNSEQVSEEQILIFPNPVNSILFMNGIEQIGFDGTIHDATGKKMISFKNENQIDISNLSKGIYFIEIETENSVEIYKFIKK
jgi:hypothetical protein